MLDDAVLCALPAVIQGGSFERAAQALAVLPCVVSLDVWVGIKRRPP